MEEELQRLRGLARELSLCQTETERLKVLDGQKKIITFFEQNSALRDLLSHYSSVAEVVIKSLIVIGQESLLFSEGTVIAAQLTALVDDLVPVELFYRDMGGIVGYQCTMLSLLHPAAEAKDLSKKKLGPDCDYLRPPGYDISDENENVCRFILEGIRALPHMAELYPVGGAADRLHLIDAETQQPAPAAKLLFLGRTLLEGLIADVQVREYLYYKLFGENITVPIAMMTSQEKNNHQQILSICEQNHWFGRPKNSFQFFCQPAVPLMDREGNWCQCHEGRVMKKPGGHGVIWKMAIDSGVFDAWEKRGIKKILVRQINNPIASCDYGLLAFMGIGYQNDKDFGFASCPRRVGAAEGINVLLRSRDSQYCLTNIEYCDFKKLGVEDKPEQEGSSYSWFPSNTNILFADVDFVKQAIIESPIPGMIVNLKSNEQKELARLESTMQNIADCLVQHSTEESLPGSLPVFLTYNARQKTISTTKRAWFPSSSLLETPEGCFYDMLHNAYDLLTNTCHFTLPPLFSAERYCKEGPPVIFLYHPALGPLYSIIGQKVRKGSFALKSEWQLNIAEIDCEELDLEGSLKITAEHVLGHIASASSGTSQLCYSEQTGKCILRRVKVCNRGIDRTVPQLYWKNEIQREEMCEIRIAGNGEFIAEDVTLYGDMRIVVEAGFRVRALNENGTLLFVKEKINQPSWHWDHQICDGKVVLKRI